MTAAQDNTERALAVVNTSLESYKGEFARLLGTSVDPEVFMSVAYEAARTNPDLLEIALSAPDSLMKALHDAAALKLVPNGVLGSAYIVPRRNKNTGRKEAHFQVGYRGLVELIIRSGHVSHVESRIVYANDDFALTYGTTPGVAHRPELFADRGKVKGAYAVAFLRDGSQAIEFMSVAQIDAIRKRAASQTGPWSSDYEEMARKTVVRRLAKMLPMSVEVQKAIELDDRGDVADVIVSATAESKPQAASLAGRIRQQIAGHDAAREELGQAEPKNVTPEGTDESGTNSIEASDAGTADDATETAATPDAAADEQPAKKKTRKAAAKAEEPESAPVSDDDDPIETTDDVPDEPQTDRPGSFTSSAKPPREMNTWSGTIEPQAGGGVKLLTEAWKAKLVAPEADPDGQITKFLAGLGDSFQVGVSGVLELVAWEKDGKAMPPYRKITAYAIEVRGAA